MVELFMQHLPEVLSFAAGLVGGSLLTLTWTRNSPRGRSSVIDQSRARAEGDIVAGSKSTRGRP
jgi:hypothetical protein